MKKKKLKKRIDVLERQVISLADTIAKHQFCCENYKPKTLEWKRFVPFSESYFSLEGKK